MIFGDLSGSKFFRNFTCHKAHKVKVTSLLLRIYYQVFLEFRYTFLGLSILSERRFARESNELFIGEFGLKSALQRDNLSSDRQFYPIITH